MDDLKHLNHRVLVVTQIEFRVITDGTLSYINQGFSRPVREPIDGAAINERGEHSKTSLEDFSHGRHSNNTMNVLLDTLDVLADHVGFGERNVLGLAEFPSASHDFLLVLHLV